jgi:hypothetical protein
MKTKSIVASTIGLLGISSMIVGAVTLAGNTTTPFHDMRMGSGQRMGIWSGQRIMPQFASTEEAAAFRTAVEKAITNKDYTAFVAAHTKYGITKYSTETEFIEMITRKTTQENIQIALEAGDYTTRKTLNAWRPILDVIDTEAKFKKLQEMHMYNEKAKAIREELGITQQRGNGMGMGMWRWMGKWMHK